MEKQGSHIETKKPKETMTFQLIIPPLTPSSPSLYFPLSIFNPRPFSSFSQNSFNIFLNHRVMDREEKVIINLFAFCHFQGS